MRVVAFGTYDVARHPRVAVLAEGLAALGAEVSECNVPLGLDTRERVAILARPHRIVVLAWKIARCWVRLARKSRSGPRPDAVLVGYMGHFDIHLARLLYRKTPLVLDHLIGAADTAADRGHGGGIKGRLLRGLDAAALRTADVVLVDTEEHRELLPDRYRAKAVVAPVGAPPAWFEVKRDDPESGTHPVRVVFFGLYTPLQGAPVVGAAAALLAGEPIAFTMIGTGQDYQSTRAAADGAAVRWLDWVDAVSLPDVVAGHDVCLGIFGSTPKAHRVTPNKVFQGAAAGCAIVTSDTPPQRRALGGAGVFVPAGDPRALADALLALARDPAALIGLREAAHEHALRCFTPQTIADPVWRRLQAIHSRR